MGLGSAVRRTSHLAKMLYSLLCKFSFCSCFIIVTSFVRYLTWESCHTQLFLQQLLLCGRQVLHTYYRLHLYLYFRIIINEHFSILFAFGKIHNVIGNDAILLLVQLLPSYLDKNCADGNCISVVV